MRLAVLLVIAATVTLIVFNPWLTVWVLAGVLAGSILRLMANLIEHRRDGQPLDSDRHASGTWAKPATVVAIGLSGVGVLAATVTALLATFPSEDDPPRVVAVVPVTYDAQASLVRSTGADGNESFALEEQVRVSVAAIASYAGEQLGSARETADELADVLARSGWENPQLRTGMLWVERSDRQISVGAIAWPPHTAVTVSVPVELRSGRPFVLEGGTLEISGANYAVLRTDPPSDAKAVAVEREQRLITLESHHDEVSVELAHPSLRNELGALVLGLSVGAVAKGGVLLVWAVLLERIGQALKAFLERVFGRPAKPKSKRPKRRPGRRRTSPKRTR